MLGIFQSQNLVVPHAPQGVLEKAGLKRGRGKKVWKGYDGDPFEFLPKWMSQNPLRAK